MRGCPLREGDMGSCAVGQRGTSKGAATQEATSTPTSACTGMSSEGGALPTRLSPPGPCPGQPLGTLRGNRECWERGREDGGCGLDPQLPCHGHGQASAVGAGLSSPPPWGTAARFTEGREGPLETRDLVLGGSHPARGNSQPHPAAWGPYRQARLCVYTILGFGGMSSLGVSHEGAKHVALGSSALLGTPGAPSGSGLSPCTCPSGTGSPGPAASVRTRRPCFSVYLPHADWGKRGSLALGASRSPESHPCPLCPGRASGGLRKCLCS